MAEQLSEKLNKMLETKEQDMIENLFNFPEVLEQFYTVSVCTPEERENIAKKEERIVSLIQKIVAIKNKHISNEEKKNQIQDLLKNEGDLLKEVNEEMQKVGQRMVESAKDLSQKLQQEHGTIETNLQNTINGNIDIESEKEALAKKELEEAKKAFEEAQKKYEETRSKMNKGIEETQMTEYKENGFWARFNRIREKGKEEKGKKTGLFKSFIGVIKEMREEQSEFEQKILETPELKAKERELEEIDNKMKEEQENQKQAEEKIKTSKENQKKLQDQKKEVSQQFIVAWKKAMEDAKSKIEESKEPIPEEEITEERVGGLFEKITAFRDNIRETRHEKKVGKLNARIEDMTEEIKGLSSDLKELKGTLNKEDPDKETQKDITYGRKLIEKKQLQRYNLAKKVEKENEKHEARKNQGQDR